MPGQYPEIQLAAKIEEISISRNVFDFAGLKAQFSAQLGKALGSSFNEILERGLNREIRGVDNAINFLAGSMSQVKSQSTPVAKNIREIVRSFAAIQDIAKQVVIGDLGAKDAIKLVDDLKEKLDLVLGTDQIRIFEGELQRAVVSEIKNLNRLEKAYVNALSAGNEEGKKTLEGFVLQEDAIQQIIAARQKLNAVFVESNRPVDTPDVVSDRQLKAEIDLARFKQRSFEEEQDAIRLKDLELRKDKAQKALLGEILTAKRQIVREQEKINDLLQNGNLDLSKTQRQSLEQFAGADPIKLARQRLGLDSPQGLVDKKQIDGVVQSAKRATSQTKKLTTSIGRAGFTVEQFGQKAALAFQRYGAFVVGSFGIFRLVGFIRSATDEALKFEAVVTKLEQVLDATRQTIAPLARDLRRLAKDTGVSTDEIGQGVFLFAQSGVKDIEKLRILAEQLAKVPLSATFGDIQQTSEGLLAVFGQFNKEVEETSRVLDLVNKFAADFAIESQDIFEIIRRGGATVAAAKVSFEDFLGLSALIRESTRESASTIGTFFKTGIARLLQPSSQKALRSLGVDANTVIGQLQQLSQVFANKSPFEQIQLAQSLVGVRQISRLIALLRELQDPKAAERIQSTLTGAVGSFDEQTSKRLDDIGTSLSRIQKSFQDFVVGTFDNDSLKKFAADIGNIAEALSGLGGVIDFISPALLGLITLLARKPIARFSSGFADFFKGTQRRGLLGAPPASFGKVLRNQISLNRGSLLKAGAIGSGLAGGSLLQRREPGIGSAIGSGLTQGINFGLLGSIVSGGNPLVGVLTGATAGLVAFTKALKEAEIVKRQEAIETGFATNNNRPIIAGIKESLGFDKGFLSFLGNLFTGNKIQDRASQIFSSPVGTFQNRRFLEGGVIGNVDAIRGENVTRIASQIRNRTDTGINLSRLFDKIFQNSIKQLSTQQFGSQGEFEEALNKLLVDTLQSVFEGENVFFRKDEIQNLIDNSRATFGNLKPPSTIQPLISDPINQFFDQTDALAIAVGRSAAVFRDFNDIVTTYNDQLQTIVTDVNSLQQIQLTGNRQDLLRQGGFGNISNLLGREDTIDQIAVQFANEFQDVLRNISQGDFGIEAQNAVGTNLESFLKNLLGIGTIDAEGKPIQISSADQQRLDDALDQYGDFLRLIAAETGKTIPEVSEDIVAAVKNGESLSKVFGGLNNSAEKAIAAIQATIEAENRRLQIQFQLDQNIISIDQGIRKFNQTLFELGDALDDVDTRINTLINRTDPITSARNRGQTLLDRSRRSQFTQPLQDFINEVRQSSTRRLEALDNTRNRGGNISDIVKDFEESLQSQVDFLDLQNKVNDRLAELEGRIRNASAAADEFIRAFEESNNQLRSTGAALSGLNADQITEGISAFNKFNAAAGLTGSQVGRSGGVAAAGAGLEALNRREFDALSQLLNTVGGFNLGGGLTGSDILGEAQRAIALPFLAELRAQFSGGTREDAQQAILKEIADAEAAAKQALEEEKRLREQQIRLVELQRELAQQERQFYVDQKAALAQIVQNTNITNELKSIASKVNQLFGSTAQPVVLSTTGGLTPNGTQGTVTNIDTTAITNSIDAQTTVMKDCVCETLQSINDNIIGIADQLNRMLNGEITTTLEVSPIQVNVSITAPDVVKTIGPVLKKAIISEIGIKLSEIFQDDPQKSSELKGL